MSQFTYDPLFQLYMVYPSLAPHVKKCERAWKVWRAIAMIPLGGLAVGILLLPDATLGAKVCLEFLVLFASACVLLSWRMQRLYLATHLQFVLVSVKLGVFRLHALPRPPYVDVTMGEQARRPTSQNALESLRPEDFHKVH